MNRPSVIVVGGGIAGLVVARQLSPTHAVTLIEANDRLGGRICTFQPPGFSAPIEAGAEFVHGKAAHTHALLKEAGIKPVPFEGKMYRREKGKWIEQEDMIEGWDALLKQMKKLDHDMTMHDFLQAYYPEAKDAGFRRHIIAFTEGFDIADVKKVSVKSLYHEWSGTNAGDDRLPNGYGELIAFLRAQCEQQGCKIILNAPVKQIDWETNEVTVYTADEQKYYAEKVIITVSLAILQQTATPGAINLTPPIDEQIQALSQIGMGRVIKVVVEFRERLWPEDLGFLFSDEIFPTWWAGMAGYVNTLTGWCGGSRADRITGDDDSQLTEKALLSLAALFEMPVDEIRRAVKATAVFNWPADPWIAGGYSYHTPGTRAALETLGKPLANTVYFTGEALDGGDSPGTVEAAIAHAIKTAALISDSSH